jgi:signal peptidase II
VRVPRPGDRGLSSPLRQRGLSGIRPGAVARPISGSRCRDDQGRVDARSRSPISLRNTFRGLLRRPNLNPGEAHPKSSPARRRAALIAFLLIAFTIAVTDQLLKHRIVDNYSLDVPSNLIGDWLRIHYTHNTGGLFSLFQGQAIVFAIITVGVGALLAGIEFRSGWRSWLVTLTLALLLGGAIGNFIDRITLNYVVDFVDIGIGTWRFPYFFNAADSAVTVAILLMFTIWIVGPMIGIHLAVDDPEPSHKSEAPTADEQRDEPGGR